jgi:hypothetical protein
MPYNTTTDILLSNSLENLNKQPGLITSTGASSLAASVTSVSFLNSGAAAINLTVNGVTSSIPAGASVSFDGGGNGNKFAAGKFSWDASGSTLLIAYTY